MEMMKRRQHRERRHLGSRRYKGSVVVEPSVLWPVNKKQPLQPESSKWGNSKSCGWRDGSLGAVVKDKVILNSKRKPLGSFSHALFKAPLILLSNSSIFQPPLLISHSPCTSKTSHTTIKLSNLTPSTIKKFSLQFLGDSPWRCISVMKLGKFIY